MAGKIHLHSSCLHSQQPQQQHGAMLYKRWPRTPRGRPRWPSPQSRRWLACWLAGLLAALLACWPAGWPAGWPNAAPRTTALALAAADAPEPSPARARTATGPQTRRF